MDLKGVALHRVALNLLGALLILGGVGLAAMTERSLLNYRAVAVQHGGEALDLGTSAQPEAGQHGYMARLVGTPQVVESPHDPEFNLTVNTPVLNRHVEMFQWREIIIGNVVHYEMDWVDQPIDASQFRRPAGHANTTSFPLQSRRFIATLVQMGGFQLSPMVVRALPGSDLITPDPRALPENLAASFSGFHNYLVTSAKPGDPRLGDLRVSWEEVPLRQMTIVARVDGSRLVAATDAADGKGFQVQIGDVSLLDLFPDLPIPPDFLWTQRILAVLLAALGSFVALSAHRNPRRDGLLALGLGALLVGAFVSVLWMAGSKSMFSGWLAVMLAGLGLTAWRLWRRPFTADLG
jgi:hypothetical protein